MPARDRACPAVVFLCAVACVPEGPATVSEQDLPEQTFLLPGAAVGTTIFKDDFQRSELGADYLALSDAWKIRGGWLCAEGAKNRGLWLTMKLPTNVSIEFDAVAQSDEGDIKVELFGDGKSGAKGDSYDDATGYIAIFGGWKNTIHALVRLAEHASDRVDIEIDPSSEDAIRHPVRAGQPYHFKLERRHGNMLTWLVNGTLYFTFTDPDPLVGPGHEHFGFNDWAAPVCFDNLEIKLL